MGDWHFPNHYSDQAKDLHRAVRVAEIEIVERVALPPMRETAREHGYALAVHGSRARDLDIIAVPWVEEASTPQTLAVALAATCKSATGWGFLSKEDQFTAKPHGRVATTIVATAEVHIDLSIMPAITPAAHRALEEEGHGA